MGSLGEYERSGSLGHTASVGRLTDRARRGETAVSPTLPKWLVT
jgi:hypothetical protein